MVEPVPLAAVVGRGNEFLTSEVPTNRDTLRRKLLQEKALLEHGAAKLKGPKSTDCPRTSTASSGTVADSKCKIQAS